MVRDTSEFKSLDDWLDEEGIKAEVTASAKIRLQSRWLQWKGGDCPVTSPVELKFRNGNLFKTTRPQKEDWEWFEGDPANDIIAYRLLEG